MIVDLQRQNAELAAKVEQLEAALVELKEEYEDAGSVDPQRAAAYKWSLTRIGYALAAPSPAVVALNAAARELDIVDIIKKVEALLHRGRAMSDLDYDKGFCYAISSVLSVLHELAEVQK